MRRKITKSYNYIVHKGSREYEVLQVYKLYDREHNGFTEKVGGGNVDWWAWKEAVLDLDDPVE